LFRGYEIEYIVILQPTQKVKREEKYKGVGIGMTMTITGRRRGMVDTVRQVCVRGIDSDDNKKAVA
jgi:hypothetical protein